MPKTIHVHLLPSFVSPTKLSGQAAIVIDVLRATTTIVQALASGATAVIPCLEVEAARQTAARLGSAAVLGGERGGLPITGFHFGNSPDEYSAERVAGKTVVFTTTNGTRAMQVCQSARRVILAAFVNFSAVCEAIADEAEVAVVCAGTDGEITREDTLLAGAIVDDALRSVGRSKLHLNDEAEIAWDAWQQAARDFAGSKPLASVLRASQGGRNLIQIGHERDIDIAAQIDKFHVVPELDTRDWRITVPQTRN